MTISSLVSLAVIILIFIVVIGYFVGLYNSLVELKNSVKAAWSNIDVSLKQRHDEIPKLVAACKEYMGYEQETLKNVIDARNNVEHARKDQDPKALGLAESGLRLSLNGLLALAENYPDLKANASFQQLQERISGLENQISDRRELYNDSVKLNNTRIEQFPASIIAQMFNFKHFDLLEFSDTEKADVDVAALFKG